MEKLKKYSSLCLICMFTLTLFSFRPSNVNQKNLNIGSTSFSVGSTSDSIHAARVVSAARKLWNKSGKEVAKFVAYEVASWLVGSQIQSSANLKNEKLHKLNKL